jgi:hypothetical protein
LDESSGPIVLEGEHRFGEVNGSVSYADSASAGLATAESKVGSISSVLLLLVSYACSDSSTGTRYAVADSANVAIVTNLPAGIASAAPWSLSAEPEVDIGAGANPEVSLFRITSVYPFEGDRVAVGTDGPPQGLVFESNGHLIATVGREGDGPGEFATVATVVPFSSDSLAVWDPYRRRLSVFTALGRFVREVDLSAVAPLSPTSAAAPLTRSGWTTLLRSVPGSFFLFAEGFSGPDAGVRRVQALSLRITGTGEELARFGPFPGEETFRTDETGAVPLTVPLPFGARTHAASIGSGLVVGDGYYPEFRSYTPDGMLERIVRWPDHQRQVGGTFLTDWNDFLDDWIASMPDAAQTAMRDLRDQTPQPDRDPAYDALFADSEEVWVGAYAGQLRMMGTPLNARVPARQWVVFDREGVLIAAVQTPAGFEPHAILNDRVWGVYEDDLEVESVRAYDIIKAGS